MHENVNLESHDISRYVWKFFTIFLVSSWEHFCLHENYKCTFTTVGFVVPKYLIIIILQGCRFEDLCSQCHSALQCFISLEIQFISIFTILLLFFVTFHLLFSLYIQIAFICCLILPIFPCWMCREDHSFTCSLFIDTGHWATSLRSDSNMLVNNLFTLEKYFQ